MFFQNYLMCQKVVSDNKLENRHDGSAQEFKV